MSTHPHFMQEAQDHYQRGLEQKKAGNLEAARHALDEARVLAVGQLDAVESELVVNKDDPDLKEMKLELATLLKGIQLAENEITAGKRNSLPPQRSFGGSRMG